MTDGHSKELVNSLVLKGKAAASGIACGPIQIMPDFPPVSFQKSISSSEQSEKATADSEAETNNLMNAVAKADRFLMDLSEHAAARGSSIDHELMEMQRLIIKDPGLIESIKSEILLNRLSATEAVGNIFKKQIERFENLPDSKIRARALDIYDISNLLLQELDNNLPASFSYLAQPCVIVAKNIAPSSLIALPREKILGIVCEAGNSLSHTAIIAASRKIPAVFNCSGLMEIITSGEIREILIDGNRGKICLNPDSDTKMLWHGHYSNHENIDDSEDWKHKNSFTADGHQIRLKVNILDFEDLLAVSDFEYDGIGLFRTEISFLDKHSAPDEEIQFMRYRDILRLSGQKHVVFRTFDLGGEKGGLFIQNDGNIEASTDIRGLELCLMYPEKFLIQLRAILRASAYGSSALLFPMVNSLSQLRSAQSLLELAKQQLTGQKLPFDNKIKIGAMIETPDGVQEFANIFQRADFICIGSNDLARYCRSENCEINHTQEWSGFDPTMLALIDQIMTEAAKVGRQNDVTLCGEIAGRPEAAPLWLSMGIRSFSVAPHNLLVCRKAFSMLNAQQHLDLKKEVLGLEDSKAVIEKLADYKI